jgi:uncharacterized protein (DUF1778 family)
MSGGEVDDMAARTDRIEARVEPDRAERIRFASTLLHQSTSSFVVDAATDRAERVIADHAYTAVPSDYFDKLLAALDEPARPVPALVRAVAEVAENPAFKRA